MNRGSPLKKCWKPGMHVNNYLIVIDDHVNTSDHSYFFNYIFTNIYRYTYENRDDWSVDSAQRCYFWKNIRCFVEFHHNKLLAKDDNNMYVLLLSKNLYNYVCNQENLFQKIDL